MSLSENVEALQKRHVACMELPYPYKNAVQPAWSFRIPTKTPCSLHGAFVPLQKVRADLHENFVGKLSSKKIHFFCNANPSAVVLRTNKIKKWNS